MSKPLEATFVVIEEVEMDNWVWADYPLPNIGKRTRNHQAPEAFTLSNRSQPARAESAVLSCIASRT
jgi:hypothetical protein